MDLQEFDPSAMTVNPTQVISVVLTIVAWLTLIAMYKSGRYTARAMWAWAMTPRPEPVKAPRSIYAQRMIDLAVDDGSWFLDKEDDCKFKRQIKVDSNPHTDPISVAVKFDPTWQDGNATKYLFNEVDQFTLLTPDEKTDVCEALEVVYRRLIDRRNRRLMALPALPLATEQVHTYFNASKMPTEGAIWVAGGAEAPQAAGGSRGDLPRWGYIPGSRGLPWEVLLVNTTRRIAKSVCEAGVVDDLPPDDILGTPPPGWRYVRTCKRPGTVEFEKMIQGLSAS